MNEEKQRLELVYGEKAVEKLKNSKVMIAGLGGVGSYAAEAITRSFIDNIVLIDFDVYDITNLNRQLHSTLNNVGSSKADNICENIYNINKNAKVTVIKEKLAPENIHQFVSKDIDFVIDAIDDIKAKISLIEYCYTNDIKIISSMGTGNKIYPDKLQISDIKKTSMCPLAKKMRYELKKRNIEKLPVVFSTEEIIRNSQTNTIGSTPFVPATAGLMLASYVVNQIVRK
ncbi:tRNA threonylcarbamoyladenosine dehydratase [Sedimentibacter sp. zth1]|uniref:tRNA threonylcarbamoyladenosine dehydratase n=1 Tax=Sedimentibacter sp. zth1 TaxID=2816908 RepID=UPI001A9298DD|nr:tRNA threonylcarbamoyladenosine dehydratase [Sedimentibacter sp. zth1]